MSTLSRASSCCCSLVFTLHEATSLHPKLWQERFNPSTNLHHTDTTFYSHAYERASGGSFPAHLTLERNFCFLFYCVMAQFLLTVEVHLLANWVTNSDYVATLLHCGSESVKPDVIIPMKSVLCITATFSTWFLKTKTEIPTSNAQLEYDMLHNTSRLFFF